MDTADPKLSPKEVKKRNMDRIRNIMSEAETHGLPPRTEETSRVRGKKKTGESVIVKKKRKNAKRRQNADQRKNRLDCLARLCVWHVMGIDCPKNLGR